MCNKVIKIGDNYCNKCVTKLRFVPDYLSVLWSNPNGIESKLGIKTYFEGFTAPFFYEAGSRRLICNFKFKGRSEISDLLALEMCKTYKKYYIEKNIDMVCFVPSSFFNRMQRGYNQSELLCKKLSKSIGLPHISALAQIKKKKTQHRLRAKDRFKNVAGIYAVKRGINIAGKNILLVDDIISTGATVNECAKVLKSNGAKSVYCILAGINN